uniref:Uncharacterized protein n=1 Tax=Solanum lycopersicum TaxID=4081 RepID=A0A3Q7GA66_SOLLC
MVDDNVMEDLNQKQGSFDGQLVLVPFLENVVANASVISSKKRGRPKGSKNNRRSVEENVGTSGTASVMDDSGQRVLMKNRLDRPKGSKNSRRSGEEDGGISGTVSVMDGSREGFLMKKKMQLGRPKGYKNNRRRGEENVGISGTVSMMDGSGEGVLMTKKNKQLGGRKGSKNKKRKVGENGESPNAAGIGNDCDAMLMKKKNVEQRHKGSKSKKKNMEQNREHQRNTDIVEKEIFTTGDFGISANQVSGRNEIVKKKIGRPKGSRNKKKVLIGRLTVPSHNEGGSKDIDSNKGKIFMPAENAGKMDDFVVGYKKHIVKRGRPRGSKTKKKVTLAYMSNANATTGHEVDVMCQGEYEKRITMAGQNGVILNEDQGMIVKKKDRRGRSRGSKTKSKVIPGHSSGTNTDDGDMDAVRKEDDGKRKFVAEGGGNGIAISNGERIFKKERRGLPKASKSKKRTTGSNFADANLNNREQDVGTMRLNVAENGMLLTEENKGDLNEGSLVSAVRVIKRKGVLGQPKGSKNKKKTIISSSSDVYSGHGVGAMNSSKEHENKMASLATDHMVGILSEVTITKIDSCSLPQGLHNENKIIESGENQHAIVDAAEDGTRKVVKKKRCRGRVKNSENKKQAAVRRGRPKGLKNKRMAGEIATVTNVVNLSIKRKNGRGRPKGSKNKKAKIMSEKNNKTAGALIVYDDGGGSQAEQKVKHCGMLPVATENGGISGDSILLDALGGGVSKRKVSSGRPKGSKNKKKAVTFDMGFPCQVSCQNAVSKMVKRRGRPKGVNDKKKIPIVSDCMGEQELSANAETSGLTGQGVLVRISSSQTYLSSCYDLYGILFVKT